MLVLSTNRLPFWKSNAARDGGDRIPERFEPLKETPADSWGDFPEPRFALRTPEP